MFFELRVRGVLVGRATLAVGQPGMLNGRRAIVVRSEVESAGMGKVIKEIRDHTVTWLDLAQGRSIEQTEEIRFGERDIRVLTRFVDNLVLVEYERGKPNASILSAAAKPLPQPRNVRRYTLPSKKYGLDLHAVLGAVRAWEHKGGESVYFYAVSDRFVWRSELAFKGTDTLHTSMGLFPALRFEGVAQRQTPALLPDPRQQSRSFTLWLTDDHQRMPLRLEAHTEYGDVRIDLLDYQSTAPRASVELSQP